METRRLITENESNEIHINKISKTDIILAIRQRKIIAVICMDGDFGWSSQFIGGCNVSEKNLSDLLKLGELSECEFRVLIPKF